MEPSTLPGTDIISKMKGVTPITSVLYVLLAVQQVVVEKVHTFSLNSLVLQPSKTFVNAPTSQFTRRITNQQQRPLQATWSNGQAVQDYQNFLSSGKQEIELKPDTTSVFIYDNTNPEIAEHYGKIINVLIGMRTDQSENDVVLSSSFEHPLPEQLNGQSEYPIYVTIPPTQLGSFLDNLPSSYMDRIDDFVFFSGGFEFGNIEDVLKERGMCRETMTQVLISGMKVINNNQVMDQKVLLGTDSVGEDKIAGECTACGKWAGSIASRLGNGNIYCRTEFYREWRRKMWERSIYDAVFNVVGAVRNEPTTLSNVATYYANEVSDIVWEMSQLLRGWRAITLTYGFEERLMGVGEFTGSEQSCCLIDDLYPFIWGSPVFLQSKTYVEYLLYAQQEMNLLQGIALPERNDDEYISNMRQGNLRADGVV